MADGAGLEPGGARYEDAALLTGRGGYAGDLAARRAEAATMAVLRSPLAAGRIATLDFSAARGAPGVLAVLGADDAAADGLRAPALRVKWPGPDGGPMIEPPQTLLAADAVRYVGQPVAIVIAETAAEAADALELIDLDIEETEAVPDLAAAKRPGAPAVWPEAPDNRSFVYRGGDAEAAAAAMREAAHVVRASIDISRVTAVTMEPRNCLAEWDSAAGRYTLWSGTQAPHRMAEEAAGCLGVPTAAVRVVSPRCGGSFGMRNSPGPELVLALWAAKRTGRPVFWTATRNESFLSDPHAREQTVEAALALDDEGRFLGIDVAVDASLGACPGPMGAHSMVSNLPGLAGVYRTPAIAVEVTGWFLNTQSFAPYRGAGRPEATLIVETLVDRAAGALGLGRDEIRRRNLIPPGAMPAATPLGFVYDSGDFPSVLSKALDLGDWAGFEARRAESASRGRLRGIGLACAIEIAGGPLAQPAPEFAALTLTPEGGATLALGACDSGQGHEGAFRRLAAARLGLDPFEVAYRAGDTEAVARGVGTFGSRTMAAAGGATLVAIRRAAEALAPEAAELLEAAAADVTFEDGMFSVAGTDKRVSLRAVMERRGEPLAVEAWESAEAPTFPNGAHLCEVEIDPETGAVVLLSYVVVDDVGTVVDPHALKGQIHGGVAQGAGQALMEAMRHDPETGEPQAATFMDYAMPRAGDLPSIGVVSAPCPTATNALGAKGAGEAGTVGALAAVPSAIRDALAPLGIADAPMPAAPEAVWRAIREAEGAGAA